MKIDVYSSDGEKSSVLELPASLFGASVNKGLMHLALVRQQSNRRHPIAHVKTRGEVVGSTKKLFQQKGTGRARRGPVRSPLLKGGGKAFGPRNNANFTKKMPKKMRRAALFSCLSLRAQDGSILGLESYGDTVKTKALLSMLEKMPVELGRKIVIVIAAPQRGIELSARNIPRVKTLLAAYLNPEDILSAKHIIFTVDAIKAAENIFTAQTKESDGEKVEKEHEGKKVKKTVRRTEKKAVQKRAPKKVSPKKSATTI